jgi:hypothetical protein
MTERAAAFLLGVSLAAVMTSAQSTPPPGRSGSQLLGPTETTRSGDAEEAETRGHLQYWDSSLLWTPFEPSYRKAKHFSVFSLCGYGQAALY